MKITLILFYSYIIYIYFKLFNTIAPNYPVCTELNHSLQSILSHSAFRDLTYNNNLALEMDIDIL